MNATPVYLLSTPGNTTTIEISQDELRSILGEIETQLHRSKVYRRALATVQNLLGSSSEQAKLLFKAVGREAIGLAFQQFAQKQKDEDINQDIPEIPQQKPNDLSQCLASVKVQTKNPTANTDIDKDNSPSELSLDSKIVNNSTSTVVKSTEEKPRSKNAIAWFKGRNKVSKADVSRQIAAEQRLENLRQIGQQLKQARESQGLSLSQLNVYTHVPIHQMEAVENANFESLPDDVFVRGFIRVMGNALGINGTILAGSLPAPETVKSILPASYSPSSHSGGLRVEVKPMHLYVGYTALVAGAVGGLSLMSQQADAGRALNPGAVSPTSSVSDSSHKGELTAKPGIKSSSVGVSVGSDIAPPEAL
jgi:cytoskeleton protein RodZ